MTSKLPERFRRTSTVLERTIDDETVLYLPATDEVIVLDAIGSSVWRAIGDGVSEQELIEALAERFAQPRGTIATDIAPLLVQLSTAGWIEGA